MVAEAPKLNVAGRYTISQTCVLLGIHRNSLRKYTSLGLIKQSFRKSTSAAFYKGTDILKFWAQEMGAK